MSEVILAGLATAVLVGLLVKENGPYEIFRKLRWKLGINVIEQEDGHLMEGYPYISESELDRRNSIYVSDGSLIAEIFSCTMCASFWVSALTFIIPFRLSGEHPFMMPFFYLSTVAISAALNTYWYRD